MAEIVKWATKTESAAERRFLECAKRQLPPDWTVIHGLRIRQGRQDREADFLVLDPTRGALVIEVKGGRIERKGAKWFSTDRNGKRHAIKDPATQARAAMYAAVKKLQRSPAFGNRRVPYWLGAAVGFPDVDRPSHSLGFDLPAETVLFGDDLDNMEAACGRIFRYYEITSERRAPEDVERFVRALKPPAYKLSSLATWIDQDGDAIRQLTDEQAQMLGFVEQHRRVAIEGAAGTGKTVLAALKAERLAQEDQRVLLLCYNRALADWLAFRATGFEAETFHTFSLKRAEAAGLPFNRDRRNDERFWASEVPVLLMDALETHPDDRYDAIIVDEGQDFKTDWWPAIESALRDERHGILYAFFDPNQDIFGGGPPDTFNTPPFSLTHNCRNTRSIASYAADLIDISYEVREGAPKGAPVKLLTYESPGEMVDKVRKQLHRLVRDEQVDASRITVLSTHKTGRSHLAHRRRLGNFELVDRPAEPMDILFTSLHKFKGLESDVVILVDVDGKSKSCSERHLYVAATRARTLLIVLKEAKAAA